VPAGPPIEATAVVPAPAEDVFAFLSDLSNHWRLVDRFVEVLSVNGSEALVRLRGPLGVRRTVHTRVTETREPSLIVGTAQLGSHTRAVVRWSFAPEGAGTRVRLSASVERASLPDRLLLALGGRAWMRRRLAFGLSRLAVLSRPTPRRSRPPAARTRPPTASRPDPAYRSEGGSS
jgi:uncharacterized protein YndB with AHSA1/START domain